MFYIYDHCPLKTLINSTMVTKLKLKASDMCKAHNFLYLNLKMDQKTKEIEQIEFTYITKQIF